MFIALFGALAAPPEAGPNLTRTGRFTVTVPWCGGMAAPREALNRVAPDTQPFAIKRGARNTVSTPVAVVQPDSKGAFTVSLPAGTYCVVPASLSALPPSEARKVASADSIPVAGVDLACLDFVWSECLAVWTLTDANHEPLEVLRYGTCSWNRRCGPPGQPPP